MPVTQPADFNAIVNKPTTLTGYGIADAFGNGQTWQTPTRSAGTTYYNTTNKPILVVVSAYENVLNTYYTYGYVDGVMTTYGYGGGGAAGVYFTVPHAFIVPPGSSYSVTSVGAGISLWREYR